MRWMLKALPQEVVGPLMLWVPVVLIWLKTMLLPGELMKVRAARVVSLLPVCSLPWPRKLFWLRWLRFCRLKLVWPDLNSMAGMVNLNSVGMSSLFSLFRLTWPLMSCQVRVLLSF